MRVLVFIAHPDDETMFAGGTIAMLSASGFQVDILCATRGEGGEAGEPPLCERDALGEVRSNELRCAASALGCKQVTFLPYRDPDVKPDGTLSAFASDAHEVADLISDAMDTCYYDAFITHGTDGEYGHPAHMLAHHAGVLAATAGNVPTILTFGAGFAEHPRKRSANQSDRADFVIDIHPVFETKIAAVQCHRTQQALFVRRPSLEAGRPVALRDALLKIESFHRVRGDDALEIVKWFALAAQSKLFR